mmetsp:Transcript_9814/g.24924  ORF Transcript_9814/g.24924 Transcript_9814/m.24924 type:complete len:86 (-) Transcript_9814:56-313(-)
MVPSASRIELKMNKTFTVLVCEGPSFFSQSLRARYVQCSTLTSLRLNVHLKLLQCLDVTSLMMQLIRTVYKGIDSTFCKFSLLRI